MLRTEVAIIGAGIAGGALATALARRGIRVILLEKTLSHQDRAHGEFLFPWGVEEAQKLRVMDVLLSAGGHYTSLSLPYGDHFEPRIARERAFDLTNAVPGVPGAMTFGHPRLCQAFNDKAQAAGATLLRGASDILVTAGARPQVEFTIRNRRVAITANLVVGADGRGSIVARQIGRKVRTAPEHHLLAGLLVEEVENWPEQEFCIGTERDVVFYVLPQGGGRVRLYLCYGRDQPRRFSGPDKANKFLAAFRFSSLPGSESLAAARPAGPVCGYPNADTWVNMPIVPGVVLIGDAAGHNDPTIGQGLSIAFRDARMVLDSLDQKKWNTEIFMPYVHERRERMRRLRIVGQQTAILRAEFTKAARIRRKRAFERIATNPDAGLALSSVIVGPFRIPRRAFEQDQWERLFE